MRAKWHGHPYYDFTTKTYFLTFETLQKPHIYDSTASDELDLDIKKHREKRSLSANNYFHLLVDKIAAKQKLSHAEVHNQLIADYGCVDEGVENLIMNDKVEWLKLEILHLRPTSKTRVMDNGELYRVFIVMRGSHTYNTLEMSRLIDGTVNEAKELGIETLPPEELERMKAQWTV